MARRMSPDELNESIFGPRRRSTLYEGCALALSCLIVFAVVVVGLWPS